MALGDALQQMLREGDNVRSAFPQRRQGEVKEMEAVIEILPEATALDQVEQRPVAGSDEPHVDGEFLCATEPPDGAFLHRRQHFRLSGGRQHADFVQEKRAAVGRFEQPNASMMRVRKCPAFVAKQLGLGQRLRQRGTINGDERMPRPRTMPVQPVRQEVFPRPGLAFDQDRWWVFFQPPLRGQNHVELRSHTGQALAEKELVGNPRGMLAGAVLVATGGAALVAAARKGEGEFLRLKGFGQVVARAEPHGFHRLLHPAKPRHDHDSGVLGKCAVAQQFERLAIRQMQVDEGEVEAQVAQDAARLLDRRGFGDLRLERAQMGCQAPSQRRVIFQQEHFAAGRIGTFFSDHAGNASKERAPFNAIHCRPLPRTGAARSVRCGI